MCENNRVSIIAILIGSFFVMNNAYSWHITVNNNTNFVIEVNCKKVGVVRHHSELIQPKAFGEVDCGLADCSKGINVVVYELSMGADKLYNSKDVHISGKWSLKCGNKKVTVSPDGKGSYKVE